MPELTKSKILTSLMVVMTSRSNLTWNPKTRLHQESMQKLKSIASKASSNCLEARMAVSLLGSRARILRSLATQVTNAGQRMKKEALESHLVERPGILSDSVKNKPVITRIYFKLKKTKMMITVLSKSIHLWKIKTEQAIRRLRSIARFRMLLMQTWIWQFLTLSRPAKNNTP